MGQDRVLLNSYDLFSYLFDNILVISRAEV